MKLPGHCMVVKQKLGEKSGVHWTRQPNWIPAEDRNNSSTPGHATAACQEPM